jgi:Ca2+-transporting ATPase
MGGYIGLVTLWLFHHYLIKGGEESIPLAQTIAFAGIILLEMMNVFNFRTLRAPLSAMELFSNPWIINAWIFNIGLLLCAIYVPFLQKALHTVPLSLADWGLLIVVSLPIFLLAEGYKRIRWKSNSIHM